MLYMTKAALPSVPKIILIADYTMPQTMHKHKIHYKIYDHRHVQKSSMTYSNVQYMQVQNSIQYKKQAHKSSMTKDYCRVFNNTLHYTQVQNKTYNIQHSGSQKQHD